MPHPNVKPGSAAGITAVRSSSRTVKSVYATKRPDSLQLDVKEMISKVKKEPKETPIKKEQPKPMQQKQARPTTGQLAPRTTQVPSQAKEDAESEQTESEEVVEADSWGAPSWDEMYEPDVIQAPHEEAVIEALEEVEEDEAVDKLDYKKALWWSW